MFIDRNIAEVVAQVLESSHGDIYLCHVVPGFQEMWENSKIGPTLLDADTRLMESASGPRVGQLRAFMVRQISVTPYADRNYFEKYCRPVINQWIRDNLK